MEIAILLLGSIGSAVRIPSLFLEGFCRGMWGLCRGVGRDFGLRSSGLHIARTSPCRASIAVIRDTLGFEGAG